MGEQDNVLRRFCARLRHMNRSVPDSYLFFYGSNSQWNHLTFNRQIRPSEEKYVLLYIGFCNPVEFGELFVGHNFIFCTRLMWCKLSTNQCYVVYCW